MDLDERRRLVQGWRGRRLIACRSVDDLIEVIQNLGMDDGSNPLPDRGLPVISEAVRNELENQATALLRMVIALNDGHTSNAKLRRH